MAIQKRNTTPKVYYAIRFPACGAESHPAFSNCIRYSEWGGKQMYQNNFPIHIKGILKSKQSQRMWAEEKAKHLRSWGVQAEIVELAQPEKVIR